MKSRAKPSREKLGTSIGNVFRAAREDIREEIESHKQGVILASTKGASEDYVWDLGTNLPYIDPVHILLEDFIANHPGEFSDSLAISNACASFLVALKWAREWIDQERVEGVWVISTDEVGPFVLNGFSCLKALSPGQSRPFAGTRDGLNLGEATVAIYVSKFRPTRADAVYFEYIENDAAGFAVTRPSSAG